MIDYVFFKGLFRLQLLLETERYHVKPNPEATWLQC